RLAPFMPVVSAVIVLLLGFGLTWGAVVRAQGNVTFAAPVSRSINEARVLYLVEREDRVKSLFITEYETDTSRVITPPTQSVAEFEVAPNQKSVAYVVQTEERENEIWLMDFASMDAKKISGCVDAICSGIVWSPNGSRIIYEHLSLLANSSGLPTLWWINVVTGEEQPVFQEAQLPGGNPRWSPNGEWLSYATPEGTRLYHLENGETRVIENILGAAALWSPNSRSILLRDVVIRHDQFVTQLFLYDLETEQIVNLNPNDGMENILAAWSPDGNFIAVVRRDLSVPRGDQIWLLRVDGSEARMLTNDADVLHSSLNWSPDGKYLLYDLYFLDAYPFETALRVIEVESGDVKDLEIKGYNPKWVW
ncbi:MAG: hypothetical protein Q8L87_01795, partial [Anaerolineales bacterium]|nr:hypothetical protein [Anaerolineales bacterium]